MTAMLEAPALMPYPAPAAPPPSKVGFAPRPFRWTLVNFRRLGETGIFNDRKVILIDGEILEVPVDNPPHATGISLAVERIQQAFGSRFYVRNQAGLPLQLETDPVPDVAVVPGSIRDYAVAHPTPHQIQLIVEVSDSTLAFDLRVKSHLYATAGIPDYWVVDVNALQLHVHREPVADETAPRGFRYASVRVLASADRIAPLAAPDSPIAVADLLP